MDIGASVGEGGKEGQGDEADQNILDTHMKLSKKLKIRKIRKWLCSILLSVLPELFATINHSAVGDTSAWIWACCRRIRNGLLAVGLWLQAA